MTTPHPTFERFLDAWEQHQRLRQSGAPIAVLSASRMRVDRLRLDVRLQRS